PIARAARAGSRSTRGRDPALSWAGWRGRPIAGPDRSRSASLAAGATSRPSGSGPRRGGAAPPPPRPPRPAPQRPPPPPRTPPPPPQASRRARSAARLRRRDTGVARAHAPSAPVAGRRYRGPRRPRPDQTSLKIQADGEP